MKTVLHATLAICLFACAARGQATAPQTAKAQAAGPASTSSARGITGEWQGTLQTGQADLRVVLKLSQGADGKLSATLDPRCQSRRRAVARL